MKATVKMVMPKVFDPNDELYKEEKLPPLTKGRKKKRVDK
jgi:hypothetical protein